MFITVFIRTKSNGAMKYIVLLISYISIVAAADNSALRVILGFEADPHSRPYQVHNVFMLKNGNANICGGALISTSYVLTAAHCFVVLNDILQTVVIMGAHNLESEDKKYQISTSYKIHKDYKQLPQGYAVNDIALIKLPTPVELSNNIQLIRLPTRSQANETFDKEIVSVAGWGKTEAVATSDILMESINEVITNDPLCRLPATLICTFGKDGQAPCVGDSGSPLVLNDTLIGVVSSGYCLSISYYTRITSFLDWIENNSDVNIF